MRGRSTFEDVESFGEWSIPELLTIQRVPPPEDVWITDFDNVERALVNQQLKVSVSLSFEWTPPLNFAGSVDRYEVILSRQPVGRFSDGSVESMTRPVTVCHILATAHYILPSLHHVNLSGWVWFGRSLGPHQRLDLLYILATAQYCP